MADQRGLPARHITNPNHVNELNKKPAGGKAPEFASQTAQVPSHFEAQASGDGPNWSHPSFASAPHAPAASYPRHFGSANSWEGYQKYSGASPYVNHFLPPQQYPTPFQQLPIYPAHPPMDAQPPPPGIVKIQGVIARGNHAQHVLEKQREELNADSFTSVQPTNTPPKKKKNKMTKAQKKARKAEEAEKKVNELAEGRVFPEFQAQQVEREANQALGRSRPQAHSGTQVQTATSANLDAQTGANMEKQSQKKGRYGDNKIMLPAPQPTSHYLNAAANEPYVIDPPQPVLVILDLNGTLIHRPNRKQPTRLIARPFLTHFLRYLFENFSVMVWSSARPENVTAIVKNVLGDDMRGLLVGCWGRDTFGLSSAHYNQNVQVYKNLKLVWESPSVQMKHPEYESGGFFDQHNTVLIDDTSLKATAQPYSLIEIPEFVASPGQMKEDVLREVAGYLDVLRMQNDVSTFMKKWPFKADGRWQLDWEDGEGGELNKKISMGTK